MKYEHGVNKRLEISLFDVWISSCLIRKVQNFYMNNVDACQWLASDSRVNLVRHLRPPEPQGIYKP